jgi:tetratricopeptide (TPR) repeat protein
LREAIKPHASISRAARAHELFFQEADIRGALAVSEEWILEEPYSSAPLVHTSYLASVAEDYEKVLSIVEEATARRITNLTLLNNAAFSLVHLGRLVEARELLDALKSKQAEDVHFSVLATDGLCKIKSGLIEEGRLAYERAIEVANSTESQAVIRVKLHMFLAMLQNGQGISDDEWESFRGIEKAPRDTAERILVSQVAQLRDLRASEPHPGFKASGDRLQSGRV